MNSLLNDNFMKTDENFFSKYTFKKKRKLSLTSWQHKKLMKNIEIFRKDPNRPFLLRQSNDGYSRVYKLIGNILIIKKVKNIY